MYIKASQPTKQAILAEKKGKKSENQPTTRPLANACKNKQRIHLF